MVTTSRLFVNIAFLQESCCALYLSHPHGWITAIGCVLRWRTSRFFGWELDVQENTADLLRWAFREWTLSKINVVSLTHELKRLWPNNIYAMIKLASFAVVVVVVFFIKKTVFFIKFTESRFWKLNKIVIPFDLRIYWFKEHWMSCFSVSWRLLVFRALGVCAARLVK